MTQQFVTAGESYTSSLWDPADAARCNSKVRQDAMARYNGKARQDMMARQDVMVRQGAMARPDVMDHDGKARHDGSQRQGKA